MDKRSQTPPPSSSRRASRTSRGPRSAPGGSSRQQHADDESGSLASARRTGPAGAAGVPAHCIASTHSSAVRRGFSVLCDAIGRVERAAPASPGSNACKGADPRLPRPEGWCRNAADHRRHERGPHARTQGRRALGHRRRRGGPAPQGHRRVGGQLLVLTQSRGLHTLSASTEDGHGVRVQSEGFGRAASAPHHQRSRPHRLQGPSLGPAQRGRPLRRSPAGPDAPPRGLSTFHTRTRPGALAASHAPLRWARPPSQEDFPADSEAPHRLHGAQVLRGGAGLAAEEAHGHRARPRRAEPPGRTAGHQHVHRGLQCRRGARPRVAAPCRRGARPAQGSSSSSTRRGPSAPRAPSSRGTGQSASAPAQAQHPEPAGAARPHRWKHAGSLLPV